MIFNDHSLKIDKVEAFYIIRKHSFDTYIKVIAKDNTNISFTFNENDFSPKNFKINEKIDLVKHIFWDITLKTNDTYYIFDISKDKVYLTRLEDNKFRLEVNIDNPDIIYCPKNESFKNLIIDVTFSFVYED